MVRRPAIRKRRSKIFDCLAARNETRVQEGRMQAPETPSAIGTGSVDGCRIVYFVSQPTMRLMQRSRTLRKDVGACVASVFLAELATFPGHGVSAPRTGHAGFVSTEQPTDILVREYCRCRAGKSERGTQHRAVELVKRAGFPGHCCTLSFLEPRTLWSNQRPRYVCNASHGLFGHHGFDEQIFGVDEQVSGRGRSD